ncbi:hypothetical protein C2G38_2221163 [Gigaspora rosea]|uniref:C2H2-type domain-containing protein n=1 Tax=Gigaspora rosea TaxID=44941 RepID=A0A397U3R5_9GLOM|nr:hypothetical protein C2G38_2221163 [Gigaspora rosea]
MSGFKCTFCPCTFENRNELSKHMNVCVLTVGKDKQLFVNNPAQVRNYSKPIKQNQNENFDINEYKSDSEFSAKKISFKDIKFRKSSKVVKDIQFNSNSNLDSTLASPLHVSNTDELASDFDNMSFELDNSNINSNISSSDEEIDQKHEEFPNEAYADLMVLVTKYKLSNAAGNAIISFFNKHSKHSKSPLPKNIRQGKEFMNNIKSNLSYKKTKVLDLDDTKYFLYHIPLISCIENILKIPDIVQNLEFEYKKLYKTTEDGKEIIYKDQIMEFDATNCDTLGKSQLHPIYMSLENIPTWRRNKQDAKQLLEVILNPIRQFLHSGINLSINNKIVWTFSKVSIIIADWPEAATFCLTYKSTNSNYPCYFCLVNREDLANNTHSKYDLVLRNHENMRNCLNNSKENSVSSPLLLAFVVEWTFGFASRFLPRRFWRLWSESLEWIFGSLPGILHYLFAGSFVVFLRVLSSFFGGSFKASSLFSPSLSQWIGRFFAALVAVDLGGFVTSLRNDSIKEKYGASILDTIDNRLANILRFPELKIFKNGIQSLARITANEYRNLMKFSKLHSWFYHTTDLIKKYGCLNGFSTETYESLYKDFVKTPYYLSNKQNIEDQIMKVLKMLLKGVLLYNKPSSNSKSNPNPNLVTVTASDNSVTFENGSIIRATDNFYGKAWYSNVAVAMNSEELFEYLTDEGICYGQIYLLIKVETTEGNVDNLALIRWYDFKSKRNQYHYGCPRLKLTELYNIVNVEAIKNNVHIIPRFDKTNDYLVNKYIF